MKCDFPVFTRCCFCFPLRWGLLVWAYLKTILTILFASYLLYGVYNCSYYHDCNMKNRLWRRLPYPLLLCTDVIFHIIFIIGAHKKNYRMMKLFYKFSIFNMMTYIAGYIATIVFLLVYVDYKFVLAIIFGIQGAICMCITVSQIYMLILVQSEIKKLKKNSSIEFINSAIEKDVPEKLPSTQIK